MNIALRRALLALLVCSSTAMADVDVDPATEYRNRIKVAETIQPFGETPFGEQVNLYKGGVSFTQIDIDYPGQGPTIQLSRSYSVGGAGEWLANDLFAGDWNLSIPRIETVVTGDRLGQHGYWQVDTASGLSNARCSNFGAVTVSPYFEVSAPWWSGYELVTGDGQSRPLLLRDNTRVPSTGGPYPAVTSDNWVVSCIPQSNGVTGDEGFLATAPDGTKYWFNYLVYGPAIGTLRETVSADGMSAASGTSGADGGTSTDTTPASDATDSSDSAAASSGTTTIYLPRKRAFMYVTRIEDRFGNYVTYNYTGSQLTSISASDGRLINLTWRTDAPVVNTIVVQPGDAKAQTWTYQYLNPTLAGRTLSGVVQPDSSAWAFAMGGAYTQNPRPPNDTGYQCGLRTWTNPTTPALTATITHPSGLTGSFDFSWMAFARSLVPTDCLYRNGLLAAPYEDIPPVYSAETLLKKTFSGPGIANQVWTYSYSTPCGSTATEGTSLGCGTSAWVEVTDPSANITRYTHDTRWGATEGKLLSVIDGIATPGQSNPVGLNSRTYTYASTTGGPYPAHIGYAMTDGTIPTNNAPTETLSPQKVSTLVQQGVTFTNTVNSFDLYGNPLSVTKASTGNAGGDSTRTETMVYSHDTSTKWVLGQVATVTESSTGKVMAQTDYDATTRLPWKTYKFGILQRTMTYNADGTLATITDGRGDVTSLSQWLRGIPRTITNPTVSPTPATTRTATVNGLGWIDSTTDELGNTTSYAYDTMGRLSQLSYPTGDTVAWRPMLRGFFKMAVAEYGLGVGHWKQVVSTGNGKVTTYYDARFQPVLTLTEDVTSGWRSFVVVRYDADGRETFHSYPVGTLTSVNDSLTGTWTTYDALGRPSQVQQTSELGLLTTTTDYLSGFITRATNPRGNQTETKFQVFDAPSSEAPVEIVAAKTLSEQQTTTITRDLFGKPTVLARSGTYSGSAVSESRNYVYDANERLCKTIQPENGATLVDYDSAGNLAWSADGTSLTSLTCDRASVAAGSKTNRTYDVRNRLTLLSPPGGNADVTTTYYDDGEVNTLTAKNATGADVVTAYEYNRRRLLTHETSTNPQPTSGPVVYELFYGYNLNGFLTSLKYPDFQIVTYAVDELGRTTAITGSGGQTYASAVTYYPNGAMSGFLYGGLSTVTHTMTQNARLLPARSLDAKSGTGAWTILDDNYTYDADGNVGTITDQAQNFKRTMWYDGLDRLAAAASDNLGTTTANDGPFGAAAFAYDPLDNLRSLDQATTHFRYNYDANWRLSTIKNPSNATLYSFTHDARGNMLSKNSQDFVFDAANRMSSVETTALAGNQVYRYDGMGRRVQTTDPNGSTTFWIYSKAGQVLYTSEGRRSQNLSYIYLGNTQVATRSVAFGTGTQTVRYQHTDALGSPVASTNVTADSTSVLRTNYTPYGEAIPVVDGTGYTGHVMDQATGLTYMQQRYYDPIVGRFLSIDPVSGNLKTGANFSRFWYANNNPYKFADPDGRYACSGTDCSGIDRAYGDLVAAEGRLPMNSTARSDVHAVIAFLGAPGEANGVQINTTNLSGAGGTRTVNGVTTITVSVAGITARNEARGGRVVRAEIANTVAHEGRHGIIQRQSGMPTSREQQKAGEVEAAWSEAHAARGLGVDNEWRTWTNAGGYDETRIEREATAANNQWCMHPGNCP